jgi:hypothetical protein
MFLVHSRDGVYLVPVILSPTEIDAAFAEVGIIPTTMNEVRELTTTVKGVAITNFRFLS